MGSMTGNSSATMSGNSMNSKPLDPLGIFGGNQVKDPAAIQRAAMMQQMASQGQSPITQTADGQQQLSPVQQYLQAFAQMGLH